MCGITGIFHLDGKPASSKVVQSMADAILHRGPDAEGIWCDKQIAFGHRRLAIIDLSAAGHQPMASRDGRFIVCYNGEVYNFQELRIELEALGYHFHSRTDTEVVLNAYAEWGLDALNRFNGLFAFAIWDKKEQALTLARDRYGIKPLYYYQANNVLLFGSEIRALQRHPTFKTNLNLLALREYFTFQNIISDQSFFEGVKLLPAGSVLVAKNASIEIKKYWDFNFQEPDQAFSLEETQEQLDFLFRQAVNRQLVSDVEIGSYLSGGMDSGSITAIAASQIPHMKSFTCGFDLHSATEQEKHFDERALAEIMSYEFATEHYEMVLKSYDMERILAKVSNALEEPRVGQSYPNYYMAKLASRFGKVVLAGTGGDELFAGYPWRYYRAVVNNGLNDYIDQYYSYWSRLVSDDAASHFFKPCWNDIKSTQPKEIFRNIFPAHLQKGNRPEDYVNHSLYFEAKTFLHGLLVMEDKLSMAHSLETRVPFLDNDLVDFAMQIPARYKLGNLDKVVKFGNSEFLQRTKDGKMILRTVMKNYIPEKVTSQIKQGFSAPDESWFRHESRKFVEKKLLDKNAEIYNFIDFSEAKNILQNHFDGVKNNRLLIWSLFSAYYWCQDNLR